MPREIKMPKLSDTMEEGTLNIWRKAEGDPIAKGDILLEIETDKADMEFEAYMSGQLAKILIPAGQTVAVGTPIGVVRLEGDSDADLANFLEARGSVPAQLASPEVAPVEVPLAAPAAPTPAAAQTALVPAEAPPKARSVAAPPHDLAEDPTTRLHFYLPDPDRVRATPRARQIAAERNVDLSEIGGSGPSGAVLVSDIENYLDHLEGGLAPSMDGDIHATPVAMRIADDMRIDLARVKGTGPGGRVTKRDLRDYSERVREEGPARSADLYGAEVQLSQKRKFLIRNMVESKQEVPHFYITRDVDAAPLAALRSQLKAKNQRATFTHLFIKAAALALEKFPEVNATFQNDRIRRFAQVNVAVAVDVQGELLAPVIKNCQGYTLAELVDAADGLFEKARLRKLTPEDYSDGTFTISNLGMFGVDHFYAIITPPMSTVLSVGSLREVVIPASDGGGKGSNSDTERGQRIAFGLSVDHRVLDGVRAAKFLAYFAELLESPEPLLADGDHGV